MNRYFTVSFRRNVIQCLRLFGLAALCVAPASYLYAAPAQKGNPATPAALTGSHIMVAGEKDGAKLANERVQRSIVSITENSITTYDKDKQKIYAVIYTLDTSTEPWRIIMTGTKAPVKGEVTQGLIQKNDNTIQPIYAARGGATPTDFTTQNNQLLFVMKKAS